jgi:hypothetical protein
MAQHRKMLRSPAAQKARCAGDQDLHGKSPFLF